MRRLPLLPALAALALTLLLAGPVHATRVNQPDPAQAVKGFFQAVDGQDYAQAWGLLSSQSRTTLVNLIARDEKMEPEAVLRLFETNAPDIRAGFWESFRNSSGASVLAAGTFTTVETNGNRARVQMQGREQVPFQAFLEQGSWRFGLVETFPLEQK